MGTSWRVALAAVLAAAGCTSQRGASAPTELPPPVIAAPTTSTPPATSLRVATVPSGQPPPSTTSQRSTTTGASTTTTTVPIRASAWVAFDEALATDMLIRGDHAVSVAVARHGEVIHRAAFGVRVPVLPATPPAGGSAPPPSTTAPVRPPEPAQPTDRFRIASLSKILTAIVTLQLVEDGQLALDDAVGARLAEHLGVQLTDPAIGAITVRQLLSHTAGFNEYEATFFGGLVGSCPEAAQRGLSRGLDAPPGTAYIYSNLNFCLLSLLVELTVGDAYEDVVRARLLEPLGIEGMRLAGTFDTRRGEVVHPSIPTRNYMEALGGAGAWLGTAADVVRIVQSLDPGTPGWHPLSPRTVELMRRPAPPPIAYPQPIEQWYGLGLIVYADGSWGHTGTIESTHAMVLHRPDGVTWSVLVSGEYPSDTSDLRSIIDTAFLNAGIAFG